MIRVEDTRGFRIEEITIGPVSVVSVPAPTSEEYFSQFPGSTVEWTCTDFHKGASVENGNEQQLANLRGISVAAVSRFADSGEDSTISANIIADFESVNANSIVGIDIQGESEGIEVSANIVEFKGGVGPNANDQFITYRVRKFVKQNSINTLGDNIFEQEELFEEGGSRMLCRRKIPDRHPSVITEWDYGGCPFGNV